MRVVIYVMVFFSLVSCDINPLEFFHSSSPNVDERYKISMKLNDERGYPIETIFDDSYSLAIIGDVHCGKTDNLSNFLDYVNANKQDVAVVNVGDLVNGGKEDYDRYFSIVDAYPDVKMYNLIGNHDLYHNGAKTFFELSGSSVYYMTVVTSSSKDVHIMLDSANGTHGNLQLNWLESFLDDHRNEYRYCVLYTHTNFFNTDKSQHLSGNYPLTETFHVMSFLEKYNITRLISGHDHFRDESEWNGVKVITINAILNITSYYKLTFSNDGVNEEWIEIK